MGALVETASADALERALESGQEGSFVLAAEDGSYHIQLRRVVYAKRFRGGGRVGFGSG